MKRFVVGLMICLAIVTAALAGLVGITAQDSPASAEEVLNQHLLLGDDEYRLQFQKLELEATQAQRGAFEDGSIDEAEYRAAVSGTIECIQTQATAGALVVDVQGPKSSPDSFLVGYAYSIKTPKGIPPTEVEMQKVSDIEVKCQGEHQSAVENAYQLTRQHDPKYVADVVGAFLDCVDRTAGAALVDVGIDLAESDGRAAITSILSNPVLGRRAMPCLQDSPSVAEGLVGFLG